MSGSYDRPSGRGDRSGSHAAADYDPTVAGDLVVFVSERDGNNHLYLYTIGGNLVKQLTKVAYDVNGFIGWDEKKNTFYYSSNEGNPTQSAIYKIDAKGKKTRISQREGTNSAIFSKSLKLKTVIFKNTYELTYYITVYSECIQRLVLIICQLRTNN